MSIIGRIGAETNHSAEGRANQDVVADSNAARGGAIVGSDSSRMRAAMGFGSDQDIREAGQRIGRVVDANRIALNSTSGSRLDFVSPAGQFVQRPLEEEGLENGHGVPIQLGGEQQIDSGSKINFIILSYEDAQRIKMLQVIDDQWMRPYKELLGTAN